MASPVPVASEQTQIDPASILKMEELTLGSSGGKPVALEVYERSEVVGTDPTGHRLRDLAILNGRVDVLRLLIARGADVRFPSGCLQKAVCHGHTDVVELILDATLPFWEEVNVSDYENGARTPLMRAADRGYVDVVRLLLRRGARPDKKDRYGHDAITIARSSLWRGRPEAAALLARVIAAGGWRKYEINGLHSLFALRALCAQGRAWSSDVLISRIFPDGDLVNRLFPDEARKERRLQPVLPDKYAFWRVISFWLPLSTNKRTPVCGPGLGQTLQEKLEEEENASSEYDSVHDSDFDE